jgi:hypothetical protein
VLVIESGLGLLLEWDRLRAACWYWLLGHAIWFNVANTTFPKKEFCVGYDEAFLAGFDPDNHHRRLGLCLS